MNNILTLWAGLSLVKRLALVAASVGMFVAVLGLGQFETAGKGSLLYAGLDARSAGEVIASLEKAGASYEVRGESIYVDASARDALRMQMASQGLPASGSAGYELLDDLSGFGTTSQMFDVTYWRAKEGELARTILALPHVKSARVHISPADSNAFSRTRKMTSSVTIVANGGGVTSEQANAIRHLVASAIGGIDANNVVVVDSVNGLVQSENGDMGSGMVAARSAEIKRNVERLLAARVGNGRAIVEVALELVREREAISERLIDPQTRVAISSETEGSKENTSNSGGDVTVASNIPDGDAAAGGGGTSQTSHNKERINYETSQTSREILREPGAVKRLTVAVLVDGEWIPAEDGTKTWQPRSEEELSALRELVTTASGIDVNRGDVLTLKSLQFQSDPGLGTLAEANSGLSFTPVNTMTVLQLIVIGCVALVLGLFVLRPILMQRTRADQAQTALDQPPALAGPTTTPDTAGSLLTGEISEAGGYNNALLANAQAGATTDIQSASNDPVERLKQLIDARQDESVEILRGWLENQEEHG